MPIPGCVLDHHVAGTEMRKRRHHRHQSRASHEGAISRGPKRARNDQKISDPSRQLQSSTAQQPGRIPQDAGSEPVLHLFTPCAWQVPPRIAPAALMDDGINRSAADRAHSGLSAA